MICKEADTKKNSTDFPCNSIIDISRNITHLLCGRDQPRIAPQTNAISQSLPNLSPGTLFCIQTYRVNAYDLVSIWRIGLRTDTLRPYLICLCDIPLIE